MNEKTEVKEFTFVDQYNVLKFYEHMYEEGLIGKEMESLLRTARWFAEDSRVNGQQAELMNQEIKDLRTKCQDLRNILKKIEHAAKAVD